VIITIADQQVILFLVMVFAAVGLWRGVKRELTVLCGIAVAGLLASTQAEFLTTWVNRFYKIATFAVKGGLSEELGSAKLGPLKPLVETGDDRTWLAVVAFSIVVVCSYLFGHVLSKSAPNGLEKALGALVGAVNGFTITRFVLPRVFATERTHVAIPSGQVSEKLTAGPIFALVLVGLVGILIVYGVRASSRASNKSS